MDNLHFLGTGWAIPWIPGPCKACPWILGAKPYPELQKQLFWGAGEEGGSWPPWQWGLWQGLGLSSSSERSLLMPLLLRPPPNRHRAMTVQPQGQRKARVSVSVHPWASGSLQGSKQRGQKRDVGRQGWPLWAGHRDRLWKGLLQGA